MIPLLRRRRPGTAPLHPAIPTSHHSNMADHLRILGGRSATIPARPGDGGGPAPQVRGSRQQNCQPGPTWVDK
eukprot:2470432-Amphidinium_carterae.1